MDLEQVEARMEDLRWVILLGSEVYLWRINLKMSIEKLSEISEVDSKTIELFEDGKESLSLHELANICMTMSVTFEELCNRANDRYILASLFL